MPKPADYPDWANNPDDPQDLVKPPASRLARGWKPAEVPPAQYWNWWKNLVGRWTRWLEEEKDTLKGQVDAIEKGSLVQAGLGMHHGDFRRVEPATVAWPLPYLRALFDNKWSLQWHNGLHPVLHTSTGGSLVIPIDDMAVGDAINRLPGVYLLYFSTVSTTDIGMHPNIRLFSTRVPLGPVSPWVDPVEIPKQTHQLTQRADGGYELHWTFTTESLSLREKRDGEEFFLRIDAPGSVGITLYDGRIFLRKHKPFTP